MKNIRITLVLLLGGWSLAMGVIAAPVATTNQDKNISVSAVAPQQIQNEYKKVSADKREESVVSESININTANAEQLAKSLNGIGMKKAEAIVKYREQYGPFTELEQLQEVSGIGPSFMQKNREKLAL